MASELDTDEYINKLIFYLKRIKDCNKINKKHPFNNTEMQLIGEIATANMEGKSVISTELSASLGVTRSAISQMINRLEAKNVVKRVSAKNDRKKIYIELTDRTKEQYAEEKKAVCNRFDKIIELMGEDEMNKLMELIEKFIECQESIADNE